LNEVDAWLSRYRGFSVVIGGDVNVNMDCSDSFSRSIRDLVNRYSLYDTIRYDTVDLRALKS